MGGEDAIPGVFFVSNDRKLPRKLMFWASKRWPLLIANSIFISPSYPFNRNITHNLERVHSINLVALCLWPDSGSIVTGKHTYRLALLKTVQKALLRMCVYLRIWEFFVLFYILIEKLVKIFQKLKFKCKVSKIFKIEHCNFHIILFDIDFQKMPSPSQISIQNVAITDIKEYNMTLGRL